jgi:hypothetical protein
MHPLILAALLLPVWLGSPAVSRGGPWIEAHPAEYDFGREMVFTAGVQSSEPLQSAHLFIRDGFSRSVSYPAAVTAADGYLLSVRRDLAAEPLFPFAQIDYWWEVELASGRKAASDPQSTRYSDDRFAWSRLEKGRAAVAWTGGEYREAEEAAELILFALGTVSADLAAPIPETIRLYLYPRLADLHSALGGEFRGWEGAVSDPSSGVILLAASAGAEGRRPLAVLLPHEMVHILLGEQWKDSYERLPLWLVEGIAVGHEMGGRPEADQALRESAAAENLIPLQALCGVFPAEEKPAVLAYAESRSFVDFLRLTYGWEALRGMIAAYAGGAECGRGPIAATGKTLDELEAAWRRTLTEENTAVPPAWAPVLAGIILLAGVLAVGGLARRRRLRISAKKEGAG